MAKKLTCWIGRHAWTTRVEQGESYRVCSACETHPRRKGRPPMSENDRNWNAAKLD
jgi:hypothetical protein